MVRQLLSFQAIAVSLLCIFTSLTQPFLCHAGFNKSITAEDLQDRNYKFTGDLDAIAERRFIRVLMPYSKTFFFFDGAEPKGLSYESILSFEKFLNNTLKNKHLSVKALIIPTSRDQLITRIREGYGDIAVGNLTITENRLKQVDFSDPFLQGVDEIVVSGPKPSNLGHVFDLAGREVHVRQSSSYHESLLNLNETLTSAGKKPVKIIPAHEHLEDEDLLEMVNAGLLPQVIIDSHKAKFWAKILPDLQIHPEVKVNSNGRIAWAIRKDNPKLKKVINDFVVKNKKGTLAGNMAFNKYLKNTNYITNSLTKPALLNFNQTVDLFRKYGKKYHFDHLMLAALGFQESRLDQKARSSVGAIGVMQVLPSTARDKNVNIHEIEKVDPNIHAGTKYLRFMANRYFNEDTGIDEFNRALFSFAAYNAGPAKVARLRKEAKEMGLNPDIWFNNVEIVASKRIGRETVQYVSNILKYYVAYKLLSHRLSQNTSPGT